MWLPVVFKHEYRHFVAAPALGKFTYGEEGGGGVEGEGRKCGTGVLSTR